MNHDELNTLIATIQKQIAIAEGQIVELQATRKAALLDEDSTAKVDAVELQIEKLQKENRRCFERIELLQLELQAVDLRDHAAYLNSIRAKAQQAAECGEKIIRLEYQPSAKKIAGALEKLAVLRGEIENLNAILSRANAEQTPDFDANRSVPGWSSPAVIEQVSITVYDCRHSQYIPRRQPGAEHIAPETIEVESVPAVYHHAIHAENLEHNVRLPGAVAGETLWHGDYFKAGIQTIAPERRAQILKTLVEQDSPGALDLAGRAAGIRERISSAWTQLKG